MLLTTIGYEGLDVQTFLNILKQNQVSKLVDIRELPLSRKRGFSKSALAHHTESVGIGYVHFPELGAPRSIRHEYREDEDWFRFSDRYKTYLRTQQDSLYKLADMITQEICCLMCFEADYLKCHRRYVASALYAKLDGSIQINHLEATRINSPVWPQPLVGIASPQ